MRLLLLALALLACTHSWANELIGRVIGVTDGDTLTVFIECARFDVPIRLAGIDAPEKGQAFGNVAKKSLSELTFGKTVTIDWNKRDKYGRLVGKVLVDGLDANLEQVKRGLAWHFKEYETEQLQEDRAIYAGAEGAAKLAKFGLWMDPEPIPPWSWRKMKRAMGQASATAKTGTGSTVSVPLAKKEEQPEAAKVETK